MKLLKYLFTEKCDTLCCFKTFDCDDNKNDGSKG